MDLVETLSNVIVVVAAFLGAFLAALWLSMVIWTFRDIRARSRDVFAQILATLVVAILTLPGLIIYVMVRPRETLAETYDRSLEEEALLQSIEERENCPGCGQRADDDWIICPYCQTRLKKHCHHCGQTLHLNWTVCPFCGASDRPVMMMSPTPAEAEYAADPALDNATEAPQTAQETVETETGD
jgi:RNA polymerase subunit RPABC4/transcription elongation factor Spt4